MDDDERERFLEETLDEAMAPYRNLVPATQLAVMRSTLREEMLADPTALRLLSAARPRAVPKQSGDVPVEGSATQDAARDGAGPAGKLLPLRKRQAG
jgi:hypothetical protein